MSRMLLGASAAALIFAYAHAAFADEAGAVTGGVAGAVGGAAVGGPVGAVVGGVGGAAVGNSMTNHRRYYHGYAYYPYHHHHHHYSLLRRALTGGWVRPRRRKALLERGYRRIGSPASPASLNEKQRTSDVVTSAAARAVGERRRHASPVFAGDCAPAQPSPSFAQARRTTLACRPGKTRRTEACIDLGDRSRRLCHVAGATSAKCQRLMDGQVAATAVRHVVIATPRSAIIQRRGPGAWDRMPARARAMEEQ